MVLKFREMVADFGRFVKNYPVTGSIVVLNAVIFLLQAIFGGFSSQELVEWGGLWPILIKGTNAYWRILTSMFLHGGLLHVISNLFVLYLLGTALERTMGPLRYFLLYMFSGIGGGLAVLYLGAQNTVTIGASGAIYGIIGALLYITFQKPTWFTPESVRSIRSLMLINLIFTFLVPGVSIPGHLGGLAIGILTMIVLLPNKPYFRRFEKRFDYGFETIEEDDYVN
jgi:rhomboid protease GluP